MEQYSDCFASLAEIYESKDEKKKCVNGLKVQEKRNVFMFIIFSIIVAHLSYYKIQNEALLKLIFVILLQHYATMNERMKQFNYFPSKCFLSVSFIIANGHEDRLFF